MLWKTMWICGLRYNAGMKIGKTRLRLHTGKIIRFKSGSARARFERVAQAIKHGFKPTRLR